MRKSGLIVYKKRYSLTFRGWLALIIIIASILVLAILNIHPFLSVTHRVNTDVLVLEGWVPDYAVKKSIEEFEDNNYKLMIVTGIPIKTGSFLTKYKSTAEVTTASLIKLGFDKNLIVTVSAPYSKKDRTFSSALALKKYLSKSKFKVKSFNIFTFGCHSRRSWLLFKKAFGNKMNIGIISIRKITYNPDRWWKTSDGVRDVIDETVAYIYARFFFFP